MSLGLGIDLGTTNTKVVLVTVGASAPRVRAVATAATPEPAALKGVLMALVREVLAGSPPPDAVGIASMAETGVPLDDDGTPLGPWLRWDGHRAGAEASALATRLGWKSLVGATGVRPSAKVPLATWAWLRTHEPDTWRAMARWAGVADYAAFLLTGRLFTDHTLAGRTMAYRLGRSETFDADLLAEVGLRASQLPLVTSPLVTPAGFGVTDPDLVHCGLRRGTPVVVAGHDHQVGSFACGVREPGDVADSLGTAEAVMTVVSGTPDPVAVGRAGMSTVVTVGGRHRAVLAGSSSAGAVVDWWLTHRADGASREELFAEVSACGDGPTGVLVLPYLSGRQTPAPDPDARLRVIGRRPGRAVMAKAMLEGLCLHTRWMLAAQPTDGRGTVQLFGGAGTANPAWTRIKAQVLPFPLRVVPAAEPVAVGAAMIACGGGPPLGSTVTPGAGSAYDDQFSRFVAAAQEGAARSGSRS